VLPGSRIGENTLIENTLIAGDGVVSGVDSRIGGFRNRHNRDHPLLMKNGLTVIGRGTRVPPYSTIGAGCLVSLSRETLSARAAGPEPDRERFPRHREESGIRPPYELGDGETLVVR
jgi:hypothetical protein